MKFTYNGIDITGQVVSFSMITQTPLEITHKMFVERMGGRGFESFSAGGPVELTPELKDMVHRWRREQEIAERLRKHADYLRRKIEYLVALALAKWFRRN